MRLFYGGLAFGLALLSFQQVGVWRNDVTLWTHAVAVTPEKPRPIINLSTALTNAGLDGSGALLQAYDVAVLRSGLERRTSLDFVWMNRAILALRQGDPAFARYCVAQLPDDWARAQLCQQYAGLCAS